MTICHPVVSGHWYHGLPRSAISQNTLLCIHFFRTTWSLVSIKPCFPPTLPYLIMKIVNICYIRLHIIINIAVSKKFDSTKGTEFQESITSLSDTIIVSFHGPPDWYAKLWVAHAPRMTGTFCHSQTSKENRSGGACNVAGACATRNFAYHHYMRLCITSLAVARWSPNKSKSIFKMWRPCLGLLLVFLISGKSTGTPYINLLSLLASEPLHYVTADLVSLNLNSRSWYGLVSLFTNMVWL